MSTTKLEAMVGFLAGRKVEPALLDELDDPSSEASRFLEATRARSKALLAEPSPQVEAPRTRPDRSGRAWPIAITFLAIAALVAFAMTLRVVDRRTRVLEAALEARDRQAKLDAGRIEALLDRLAEPKPTLEPALKRVEEGLARVEARPEPSAKLNPSVAALREELAAIHLELSANERAAITRSEELQAALHNVARLLKLLIDRIEPVVPTPAEPRRPKP